MTEYFVVMGKQFVYMWSVTTYWNQVFEIINETNGYYVQTGDFTDVIF